jgi:hypothetical protein
MIAVAEKPDTGNFDDQVRQPGLKWLQDHNVALDQPPPHPEANKMRASHFEDYLRGNVSAGYLERHSPLVWYEARRQGLL